MRCVSRLSVVVGLFALVFAFSSVAMATTIHDATADFQLLSNPSNGSGGWQYCEGGPGGWAMGSGTANWNAPDWGAGMPGWEGPAGNEWKGWAKVTDGHVGAMDVTVGDLVTHGMTGIVYKFQPSEPDAFGILTISGYVWNARRPSAAANWAVWKNDVDTLPPLTWGTLSGSVTRDAPMSLASGSGGAAVLVAIPYVAGDFFRLEIDNGNYTGCQFVLTTTPIPEPGSLLLLGSGLLGLLAYAWRKRR